MIVPVQGADDPAIAAYQDLRDGRLSVREGLYVIEGDVVLRVALKAGVRLHSLLLADNRVGPFGDVLPGVSPEVPIYVAMPTVLERIAGFPIHRGVLALGVREPPTPARDLLTRLGNPAIVLASIGIANHDNMGGLFRNAAAFGARAIVLDSASCDPLYRKALRVSVGAALLVPFARMTATENILALSGELGFRCLALTPRGATRLDEVEAHERTMLLLGSEGAGLPEPLLAGCETVRIPMARGFDSLNVATASGIALHHLLGKTEITAA